MNISDRNPTQATSKHKEFVISNRKVKDLVSGTAGATCSRTLPGIYVFPFLRPFSVCSSLERSCGGDRVTSGSISCSHDLASSGRNANFPFLIVSVLIVFDEAHSAAIPVAAVCDTLAQGHMLFQSKGRSVTLCRGRNFPKK